MKRLFLPFLLSAVTFSTVVLAADAVDSPRVNRGMIVAMEKSLDNRVARLWDDDPFVLLGPARGVYLEGYGAVFTAEINLATGPTMMMQMELSKDEIERHRQKKIKRVPELVAAMRLALVASAASLDPVPQDEQIVIVAFLSRYPWEDVSGLPAQITMQAQKKKLLDAQRAGGTGLESAIRVTY
jgi:hypothetical protein